MPGLDNLDKDNKIFLEEGNFFMINLDKPTNNRYFGEKNFFSSGKVLRTSLFELKKDYFVSRIIRIPFPDECSERDRLFINTIYNNLKANAFTYKHHSNEEIAGEIYKKIEIQFCNIPQKYLPKNNL